jgi:chromate transporter
MERSLLWQIVTLFASLSVVAIGGANALVPELHRQVVDLLAWMDDATFARLFAIAQAAPGPNVMFASIIGWYMAGLPGLTLATIAILLPSSLIALAASRGLRRHAERRPVKVLTLALVPIALGLMLASGVVAALAAEAGLVGYGLTAATALVTLATRFNPLVPMAAGTAAYVAAWLAGLA